MNETEFKAEVWALRVLMLEALKRRLTADGTEGGAKMAPTELGAINNFLKMNGAELPDPTFSNIFGDDE